jgi:hypothetical protein
MNYILINQSYDGDSYKLYPHTEEGLAQAKEDLESGKEDNYSIVIAEVETGRGFGWGNRGELYGAEVIEERINEDE